MRHVLPPKGVAPEVLFRRLLTFPAPSAPVDYRIRGLEHSLAATALPASLIATAIEAGGDVGLATVIAHSLTAGGLLVFGGPDEVLDLTVDEFAALATSFQAAFDGICPIRTECAYAAWMETLTKGASHESNATARELLGGCYESINVGKHIRIINRPERYFGCAPRELLDGHLMCVEAARRLHEQKYSTA